MFFTAEPINAQDSLNVGILDHLVPAAEIEAFTAALAAKIRKNSPLRDPFVQAPVPAAFQRPPRSRPRTFELIQSIRRRGL